jgi:hypothetical protein
MQLGEEIRQQAGFILNINLPFKTLYGRALYSHEPTSISGAVKVIARPELQIFDYDLNGLCASKQFLQLFLWRPLESHWRPKILSLGFIGRRGRRYDLSL